MDTLSKAVCIHGKDQLCASSCNKHLRVAFIGLLCNLAPRGAEVCVQKSLCNKL